MQGLTYPRPASASQSHQRALPGCSSLSASQKSSGTHQRLRDESEMMPGEAAKIPSSLTPSSQEMLTQAEVLLASPAKDVDELGLICAPFQLSGFQQVLVGWGRQEPKSGCCSCRGLSKHGCPWCPPTFHRPRSQCHQPRPCPDATHPSDLPSLTLASCSTRSSLTTSSSSLVPCGTEMGSALPGSGAHHLQRAGQMDIPEAERQASS